jgi:hypothetical protein
MSDFVVTEAAAGDTGQRLAFFKKLQAVATKLHATSNLDEIMLDAEDGRH